MGDAIQFAIAEAERDQQEAAEYLRIVVPAKVHRENSRKPGSDSWRGLLLSLCR